MPHGGTDSYDSTADGGIVLSNDGDFPTIAKVQMTFYVRPNEVVSSGNEHEIVAILGDTNSAPSNPHLIFAYRARHSDNNPDRYELDVTTDDWTGSAPTDVKLLNSGWNRTGFNIWQTAVSWIGFRIKIAQNEASEWYVTFYMDENDDGNFTLIGSHALDSGTPPTYIHECAFEIAGATGSVIFLDDIEVYDFTDTDAPGEIATLTNCNTLNEMNIGGSFTAIVHDLALANIATLKAYLWQPVEIWDNELTLVLWEGWITNIDIAYNHVTFTGANGLKILNEVLADYNGILAEGEVTSTTADTIDDSSAAFTAALVTKLCTFTDAAGPSTETDYPNSNSDTMESDKTTPLTMSGVIGTYADLATEANIWEGFAAHPDCFMYLEYTVANAATSTFLKWEITAHFRTGADYTDNPQVFVYDDNGTSWELLASISPPTEQEWRIYSYDSDDFDGAIANYVNGTTIKFGMDGGAWASGGSTNEKLTASFAPLVNTFSTVFPAGTVYTIDARDANTLTFTGQSTTGIGAGDRYKVGDYLHNVIETIWNATQLDNYMALDYETSTNFDAADYSSSSVGGVLRMFAAIDGRNVWHKRGWTIQSLATKVDTGIDLTQAKLTTDPHLEGWTYQLDGNNIRRKIKIFGGGITVEGDQVPTYNSPLGLITTDNRIATQQAAETLKDQKLTDHANESKKIMVTINFKDTVGYAQIEVGKTIDLSIYSAAIAITAGDIMSVEYNQTRGGQLFCRMVIDDD